MENIEYCGDAGMVVAFIQDFDGDVDFEIVDNEDIGRYVYLTQEARKTLKSTHETNISKGHWNSNYLFVFKNGECVKEGSVIKGIYQYCNDCGMPPRGVHKIR